MQCTDRNWQCHHPGCPHSSPSSFPYDFAPDAVPAAAPGAADPAAVVASTQAAVDEAERRLLQLPPGLRPLIMAQKEGAQKVQRRGELPARHPMAPNIDLPKMLP